MYGASKLFCEHLVKTYARQCDCGYAILRYGHIYGPGEGGYAKIIPQVIRSLLRNESPAVYGDGSVKRDFLFVGDAVEATIRVVEAKPKTIEAVNIVSGDSKTIREYVNILAKLVGYEGEIKYLLDKPRTIPEVWQRQNVRHSGEMESVSIGKWLAARDQLFQEVAISLHHHD